MQTILIALVVVLLLLLGVGGGLYLIGHRTSGGGGQGVVQDTAATQLAGALAQSVETYRKAMEVAAAEPEVIEAMASGDKARIASQVPIVTKSLPPTIRVRLLPPGLLDADSTSNPPLTYGSLALMRHAMGNENPIAAEVHLFGSIMQNVVIIERIRGKGGKIVGFLHVNLDAKLLQQALDNLPLPSSARVEIQQPLARGAPLVVAQRGDKKGEGEGGIRAPIPNTGWEIAYWGPSNLQLPVAALLPSTAGATAGPNIVESGLGGTMGILLALGGGAVVVVFLGGMGFLALRRRPAGSPLSGGQRTPPPGVFDIHGPGVVIQGALKVVLQGQNPMALRLMPGLTLFPGAKLAEEEGKLSEGLDGDDITNFVRPPEKASKPKARPAPLPELDRSLASGPAENMDTTRVVTAPQGKPKPAPAAKVPPPPPPMEEEMDFVLDEDLLTAAESQGGDLGGRGSANHGGPEIDFGYEEDSSPNDIDTSPLTGAGRGAKAGTTEAAAKGENKK